MSDYKLGKLKQIDLRETWKREDTHFTSWLSEEDNLALLGEEIGFEIKHLQTEAAVGNFYADILAEEENTGRKIIIENQLEVTNHDHLGKIITYASGYDAQIIVWVVKDVREEHRQAIDWLNEHTEENIEFYLVQIELWQIGNSPYAPKFVIISKPNGWTKTMRSVTEGSEPSETRIKQMEFWNQFKEYATNKQPKLRLQKPSPQHWLNISIGSSSANIALTIHSRKNAFGVAIYIPDNKELYEKLYRHKNEIETELGESVEWMPLPNKMACRIRLLHSGSFDDVSKWEDAFNWLLTNAEKFKVVFPKYINLEE